MTLHHLTEAQETKLRDLVRKLRAVASARGVQAALWDAIFDMEAKLDRGTPLFPEEAQQTIALAETLLRNSRGLSRRGRSG